MRFWRRLPITAVHAYHLESVHMREVCLLYSWFRRVPGAQGVDLLPAGQQRRSSCPREAGRILRYEFLLLYVFSLSSLVICSVTQAGIYTASYTETIATMRRQ
jgi:hypothetical protein